MKKTIAVDFHGTLSTVPRLFRSLHNGSKLIIITASPERMRDSIVSFCRKENVQYEKIIMLPNKYLPFPYYPSGYSAFKRKWKIEQILKLNPDYFIDNEELITRELYRHRMEGRIKTQVMLLYQPELYDIQVKEFPAMFLSADEKKALSDHFKNTRNLKREKGRQMISKLIKKL